MDKIKFRIYLKDSAFEEEGLSNDYFSDPDIGRMHEVTDIDFDKNKVGFCFPHYYQISLDHVELMQYTGLKDINNKEICEDDILKIDGSIAVIVWMNDGFKLVGDNFLGCELYPQVRDGIWGEVIGNSHENPELMESQNETR